MRGQKRVEDARERAYDPRIHLLREKLLRRWMDCRVKPGNDSEAVVPAKAGTHDHRRWLWVPALRPLSRASAGTTSLGGEAPSLGAKHQPAGARNDGRGNFVVLGLLFTMTFATRTCRAAEGQICYPKCVTPYVTHDVAPSVVIPVVILCVTIPRHNVFGFEAPMPPRRIHIELSNPPPGPRPR
jgi:hypothetical protein